ncbi:MULTISPECIES: hypothetical protein [unclassified Sphingobacterium]|uniref:hypothetical protein n=1 Tax=Sphingobacterium TaxID=28453 RepID=UPI002580D0B9|nr:MULTISPECIES: hypothetical protein [unclassified Sphingobacterium]
MFGENVSYDLEVEGFKIADIPAGGGLATAFVSPGKVLEDTIEVNPEDPTETNFTAQGESLPTETAIKSGITKGAARLFKVDTEVAADLLGGTVVAGQYHAPRNYKGVERALQIIDGKGMPYTYPRVRFYAKIVGRFRVSEPNTIDLSWTVLNPADSTVSPEIIGIKTP